VILVKVRLVVHGEVWEHLLVADRAVSIGDFAVTAVGLVAQEVGTVGCDVGHALGTKTPEIARSFRIAVVRCIVVVGGDAASSADGHAKGQEIGLCLCAHPIVALESETLVLSVAAVCAQEVVLFHRRLPVRVVRVVPILRRQSKATTNTVVDRDRIGRLLEGGAASSFLVVMVFQFRLQCDWCCRRNLRMIHHLSTAGADSDDLTELRSLLNVAEKFFSNTFNWVEMSEVSVDGRVPAVNVDRVERRVAVPAVALVTTLVARNRVADLAIVRDVVVVISPTVGSVIFCRILGHGQSQKPQRKFHCAKYLTQRRILP